MTTSSPDVRSERRRLLTSSSPDGGLITRSRRLPPSSNIALLAGRTTRRDPGSRGRAVPSSPAPLSRARPRARGGASSPDTRRRRCLVPSRDPDVCLRRDRRQTSSSRRRGNDRLFPRRTVHGTRGKRQTTRGVRCLTRVRHLTSPTRQDSPRASYGSVRGLLRGQTRKLFST